MKILETSLGQIESLVGSWRPINIENVVTLAVGQRVPLPNLEVILSKEDGRCKAELKTDPSKFNWRLDPESLGSVEMSKLKEYAKFIDENFFGAREYRKVLDNLKFQQLYGMTVRTLKYVENGIDCEGKPEKTGACMQCGLVLPWLHLSIDHQRPQARGQTEAVLKTLRALGLTEEGPKGVKGQAIVDPAKQGVVQPKKFRPVELGRDGDRNNRYTLNYKGIIFYTLICAKNQELNLARFCMHGLVNLRPYCNRCNSKRKNPLKYEYEDEDEDEDLGPPESKRRKKR